MNVEREWANNESIYSPDILSLDIPVLLNPNEYHSDSI